MKKIIAVTFMLSIAALLIMLEAATGQRGGRGGGGGGRGGGGAGVGRGGGVSGGSISGANRGGTVGSFGGGAGGARPSNPIVGPGGGAGRPSVGGGPGGGIGGSGINMGPKVGGGPVVGGGPGGGGRPGVGGGPGIGGGPVGGPGSGIQGGKNIGGKVGNGIGGPGQGSLGDVFQGGANLGPKGGIAGKAQGGIAGGAYGGGAVRSGAVAGRGTYYRSSTAIRNQGVYVRQAVRNYPCFRPGWYTQHPGAWFAAGWAAGAVWRAATWGNYSTFCSYPNDPPYYDYGENVVYQEDGVYIDGEKSFTTQQYAQRATEIADAGRDATVAKDEEWLPLGIFAMAQGEEQTSNHIFQLAVNKQGVIRGNYYDAVTDSTSPVYGSVNKNNQRAAWTVGDRKSPVYEAGIANLTKNETTMLVHYDEDRTQQFTLIRIEELETGKEK